MIIRDVCIHYDVRFSDWHLSIALIWFTLDEVHNERILLQNENVTKDYHSFWGKVTQMDEVTKDTHTCIVYLR